MMYFAIAKLYEERYGSNPKDYVDPSTQKSLGIDLGFGSSKTAFVAKRVQFVVIGTQDPQRIDRKFELSRKHVAKVYNELQKCSSVIEIYRSGTGKETTYIPKSMR